MTRRIIKHANRRLYDAEQRRAITLLELSTLLADGENIVVELKETGEDITAETLLLCVLEHIRRNRGGRVGVGIVEAMLAAVCGAVATAAERGRHEIEAGGLTPGGGDAQRIDGGAVALPARDSEPVEAKAAEPGRTRVPEEVA
jgi:hypothetical protein